MWIGHSFGGRLAFELAVRRPDAVERLVLLDPALQIDAQIALYVAEDGRKDRSFASFDEGVDRRFGESFLSARAGRSSPAISRGISSRATTAAGATATARLP